MQKTHGFREFVKFFYRRYFFHNNLSRTKEEKHILNFVSIASKKYLMLYNFYKIIGAILSYDLDAE